MLLDVELILEAYSYEHLIHLPYNFINYVLKLPG